MNRWVLHIDMDAFFASVEQLTRPTLRGRPVLVGGVSGRGVVAGASYEARAFGARSAMPMHQAKALVGFKGVCVRPRHEVYATASRRVFDIVSRHADVVERISIDEAFLEPPELAGASQSHVTEWAEALREAIRTETGLASSIGAGSGKQTAKIGSGMAKPDGIVVIPKDKEPEMIWPLPVRKLWGVGPVAEVKLHRVGITTIGEIAASSAAEIEAVLGNAVGLAVWNTASGRDTSPVAPRADAKSIGAEYTYPRDLMSRQEFDDAIERAWKVALARLRDDGRGARTVSVKIKTADFHTQSRSQSFLHATDDERVLHGLLAHLVRYPEDIGPVRLVGVAFSNLEYPSQQMLFPELHPTRTTSYEETDFEAGVRSDHRSPDITIVESVVSPPTDASPHWFATQDVFHPEYGHGWIQGVGHGILTVRFETRTSERSFTKTFATDTPDIVASDPLDSLDWGDWLAEHG